MLTRKNLLSGACSHYQYWGQFSTDDMRETLLREFGLHQIILAGAPNFNRIALKKWDALRIPGGLFEAVKQSGDVNARSVNTIVCAYKACAQDLVRNSYIACATRSCGESGACCKRAWHHLGLVCTHCGLED